MAREMKDSGIEWIDEIPKNWGINRVRNIFKNGKGLPITKENLIDDGLAVISYGQIHSKINTGVMIRNDLLRFVDFKYKKYYPQCQVYQYDFIFADTSEDSEGCGNCVYKRDDSTLFAGYHSIILHSIIPQDNRYLAYLFKTDCWRKQLREVVTGVKVFSITQKALINSYVIIPPFDEQQKIADYLDGKCIEIDILLSDIQLQIDVLKEYKASVIIETVTKGLNPNVEMKDSEIEWIGEVPKKWEIDRIKYHLRRNEQRNPGNTVVLSVYREYGVIPKDSRDDNHNVTSEDITKYKYVKIGSLVINKMKAWQGSMAVSQYEGIVSPAYFIYEFIDNKIDKRYFHYLVRECYKEEFRRLSGGIREGQWDLSPDEFGKTLILMPPIKEQQEIVNILDKECIEIENIILYKSELLKVLEQYKKSLIYEYVTGKREVSLNDK